MHWTGGSKDRLKRGSRRTGGGAFPTMRKSVNAGGGGSDVFFTGEYAPSSSSTSSKSVQREGGTTINLKAISEWAVAAGLLEEPMTTKTKVVRSSALPEQHRDGFRDLPLMRGDEGASPGSSMPNTYGPLMRMPTLNSFGSPARMPALNSFGSPARMPTTISNRWSNVTTHEFTPSSQLHRPRPGSSQLVRTPDEPQDQFPSFSSMKSSLVGAGAPPPQLSSLQSIPLGYDFVKLQEPVSKKILHNSILVESPKLDFSPSKNEKFFETFDEPRNLKKKGRFLDHELENSVEKYANDGVLVEFWNEGNRVDFLE